MDLSLESWFCTFSYSTGKTKQTPDWNKLFCLQVGPSCSNLSVNLQNHNSHWHQSSSEVSLSQRLIHQDRHEDSSPAEQRAEPKQAGCSSLAIDPPASVYLPPPSFLSGGKITLSTLSWQNDRGSFNHFASRITVSAHPSSQSFL